MTTVEIPSFNWSSQYYAQILESLVQFKRTNVPELTNESPEEPLIQLLRAFALVGHLNNVLADLVANECTLPTSDLPETVRNMLKLIDYAMSSASPAQADIVFELSQVFTSATAIISAYAQVGTERTAEQASIPYEILTAVSVEPTDEISSVQAWDQSASTWTDYTTEANDATAGQEFTPWGSPVQSKDALYVGHESVQWDKLSVDIDTAGDVALNGVWEYYDGDALDGKPDDVTKPDGYLRFDLNGILGSSDRSGLLVRVQLDVSGSFADIESQYSGGINFITTEFADSPYLGQTGTFGDGISNQEADYTVGSLWKELPNLTDGTDGGAGDFEQDGDVEYTLPESLTHNWQKTTIQGTEAYWMRYRVIDGVTNPPTLDQLRIDTGKQYVKTQVTQGQRKIDSPLGTADGTANQRFDMTKDYFIWASETITVEAVAWARVDSFLQSTPTSRHYTVELGENDRATIVFGDGTRGAKPSGTVVADYRWGANEDGNAGASTIVRDNSGISFVTRLWNPRAATGWQRSQIADEESLELAKIEGPASLRIVNVALGPDDVETMTLAYTDAAGSRPFVRALAIEAGFGPKTMELVVVAAGAGAASGTQLTALEEYFNGDRFASPPVDKKLIANQEVTARNYTPVPIDITADVYGDVTAAVVQDYLTALLQPETKQADGVTFEWVFGEEVYPSRLVHEIFKASSSIYRVDLTVPATPVTIESRELPTIGTLSITIKP